LAQLPAIQLDFLEQLLNAMGASLLEVEQLAKKASDPAGKQKLAAELSRSRATVRYAQALLRYDALPQSDNEQINAMVLVNNVINTCRKDFIYAGVTVHRPQLQGDALFVQSRQTLQFLLEEMLLCALRCAPDGRHLYIGAKQLQDVLLLTIRTEGRAVCNPPLLPLTLRETDGGLKPLEDDYAFSLCSMIAKRCAARFRSETDGAGARMFLEIPLV
jgi:hypothetical protein